MGKIMTLSKILAMIPWRLYNHFDIKIPNKVTIIVLIRATLSDIQNGVISCIAKTSYTSNLYSFKIAFALSVFKKSTHAFADLLSVIVADL